MLLAVGLLHEGDVVTYKSRSGKVMAHGVVKGTGILCSRCGQLVGATEFEQCAGSGLRRPCENIYTADNTSLQDLLVQVCVLHSGGGDVHTLCGGLLTRACHTAMCPIMITSSPITTPYQADKIMLDRANNVGAAVSPMEPSRPSQAAGWPGAAAMHNPSMLPFTDMPPAAAPHMQPMQHAIPNQLHGNMDINTLRQVAYGNMGGPPGMPGLPPSMTAMGNHFADSSTLQNLQAMFGGGDDSSDDGDSEGEGPSGGLQGLAGMLPVGAFGGLQGRMGGAADALIEQYAALYVEVCLCVL